MTPAPNAAFDGAKAALFIGKKLLVIRRDTKPGLRFAGLLDFPGGGREGDETPMQTLLREIHEEVGLRPNAQAVQWQHLFPAAHDPALLAWFFVLHMPADAMNDIVFGDEGQGWQLMPPTEFLNRDDAVPALQSRLRLWQHARTRLGGRSNG